MKSTERKPQPPRWASRLLEMYCAPHLLEEIQGDLEEQFYYELKRRGLRWARLDYIRHVFGFMRPFAMRRKRQRHSSSFPLFRMSLYKHFLVVAVRNIGRHKAFSGINIAGLALGMTCCLFILLWVRDELAVDNFHPANDRLYAVYQTAKTNSGVMGSYTTPIRYSEDNNTHIPIADMQRAVPEIEYMAFYATGYELPWGHPETFEYGDKLYKLEGSRASTDFFTMFHYPVLAGDARTALTDISSIAISHKMALMFFGSAEEALGKALRYENKLDFTVTAVFADVPRNSSLRFDFLINWASQFKRVETASSVVLTAIQLKPGASVHDATMRINRYLQTQLTKDETTEITLGLQPFHDRYRLANFEHGKPASGRLDYIHIFTGVAVFVLLIACINFMNLSTARSVKRAKEVGMRKVAGSSRMGLIAQFVGESVVLSFVALLVSVTVVAVLLPVFNTFTEKNITLSFYDLELWGMLIGLTLVTGFVAGSYPALFLSSLKPVRILKGVKSFTSGALWFRRGLAVFQFVISIVLLIVTIVITRQTDYVRNANLGYDRENLIYIRVEGELAKGQGYATFKAEAEKVPGVMLVDRASEAPHAMGFVVDADNGFANTLDNTDAIQWEGKTHRAASGFNPVSVGYDFVKIMNLQIAEGRDFNRANPADSSAFLVNEEAVRQMEMDDPIGKRISAWSKKGYIIGVLKDYHTHSFYQPIRPLIVDVKEYEYFGVVMVRTERGKTPEALAGLEQVYKTVNPHYPFVYQFLDREYDTMYDTDAVVSRLSNAFAVTAIGISCLGLLGLVMFSAEQRAKEFGIRKVLGASVGNIVGLLSGDFLRLVLVSFCIAMPLAGYAMYVWLQGFAFRIALEWWMFVGAGAIALGVAAVTVGIEGIRSAVVSPVRTLKSE